MRRDLFEGADKANCRGSGLNFFFMGPAPEAVVNCCNTCPVKAACLQHALEKEKFEYWAGTTAYDRTYVLRLALGIKEPGRDYSWDWAADSTDKKHLERRRKWEAERKAERLEKIDKIARVKYPERELVSV